MNRPGKTTGAIGRVVPAPDHFGRHGRERRHRFDTGASLAEFAWALVEGRWTVLGLTLLALALGAAYAWLVAPQYESTVMVQVDPKTRMLAGLEEITAAFSEVSPADTEMQIIRSRTLLRAAVEELHLDVEARPVRFPVVGGAVARAYSGTGPAPAFLGLSRYAWGGDRISVARLSVPDHLLGKPMLLTAGEGGRYVLANLDGVTLTKGEVGVPADIGGMVGDAPAQIFVQDLVARPGVQFRVVRHRTDDVVASLGRELRVTEPARRTGVIVIALGGPDPVRVAATLNAVATAYQRQNVMFRSADAAKTLDFLESQLPTLKQNLDRADAALNAFRLNRGTVDLSKETQTILDRTVELEKAISDIELQRAELRQKFTGGHPALASADQKVASLRAQQAALQSRIRSLPETEVDSARLVRDAKVANELYFQVSNRAQELRILKSGTVGNVRIIDPAIVPTRASSPNRPLVLVLAGMLGLGLGATLVFVRKAMDRATDDPDEIEAATGIPVLVTVPHSRKQGAIMRAARRHPGERLPMLSAVDTGDAAVESLRVLRTSLQVAMADARNNVIAVGGPSPGVGKTFVGVNLADVMAAAGQRVLLVDGDLRRGTVHRYFGLQRGPGISEVLTGELLVTAAVRPSGVDNLDVLTTGRTPNNPSEVLAGARFRDLLEALSRRYDLVVIDTPPVLAVADSALVAAQAGLNLLVLKAGRHPLGEISLAVKRFEQGGSSVGGIVLNDVRAVRGRYGRDGQYQRYEYRSVHHD